MGHHETADSADHGPGNGFRVREAQVANDQIQLMLRVLSREQRLPPQTLKQLATTHNIAIGVNMCQS